MQSTSLLELLLHRLHGGGSSQSLLTFFWNHLLLLLLYLHLLLLLCFSAYGERWVCDERMLLRCGGARISKRRRWGGVNFLVGAELLVFLGSSISPTPSLPESTAVSMVTSVNDCRRRGGDRQKSAFSLPLHSGRTDFRHLMKHQQVVRRPRDPRCIHSCIRPSVRPFISIL